MTSFLLRVLATAAGAVLAAVPRRYRFDLARRVGLAVAPLLALTPLYATRPSRLDGPREEAVRLALHLMRRLRVRFDPKVEVKGDPLPAGAAIVAGAHFGLHQLPARWLFDRGDVPAVIAYRPNPAVCYIGSDVPIHYLDAANAAVLVQARCRLAEGKKIIVLIDDEHAAPGLMKVDTVAGPRWVSDAIPRFAERIGVPLFFVHTRIEADGRLASEVRAAPRKAEEAFAAWCEQLVRDAAGIRRK